MKTYRHYVSMDLYGNGIGYNIVIVKEDENNGDVYFIKEEDLDNIDRKRMQQILAKRNAENYPLWDLMSQTTLKNGVNALEYFHQMVQVRTASGQIIPPSAARQGMRQQRIMPQAQPYSPQQATQAEPQSQPQAEPQPQSTATSKATGSKKRGPGRPKKSSS